MASSEDATNSFEPLAATTTPMMSRMATWDTIGSATVTISEGGDVKITSPASITVQAASELKLTATTLTASAATVNITGAGGDVVVSGKSLVMHTHNGNLGKPTTPPL